MEELPRFHRNAGGSAAGAGAGGSAAGAGAGGSAAGAGGSPASRAARGGTSIGVNCLSNWISQQLNRRPIQILLAVIPHG